MLRLVPVGYFWTLDGNVLDAKTDRWGFGCFVAWVVVQVVVLGSQEILGPRWFVNERWSWVPEAWEWRPVLKEGDEEKGLVPVGGSVVVRDADGVADKDEQVDEEGQIESGRKSERVALVGASGRTVERVYDCAICQGSVRVPVVASGRGRSESNRTGQESAEGALRRHGEMTTMWWTRLVRRAMDKVRRLRTAGSNTSTGMDEEDYSITPCRHVFHWQCIASWLQYRSMCPICRTSLPSM